MLTGISTACLYPMETEKALDILLGMGYRVFEIFTNTQSELSDGYVEELSKMLGEHDASAYSVHLFSSGYEPHMFFSNYQRRFDDSVLQYRRHFAAARKLGAKVVVFHGDRREGHLSEEEHCRRLKYLCRVAADEGVCLAQENVSRCRSFSAEAIRQMRRLGGGEIKFVLDIKQALRAGCSPFEMLDAMGEDIRGVHVSDSDENNDCLLPGDGNLDFKELKARLLSFGYQGPMIVEVYRNNYQDVLQFGKVRDFLNDL
jgi:sugar phosphate isomerase/epimerase